MTIQVNLCFNLESIKRVKINIFKEVDDVKYALGEKSRQLFETPVILRQKLGEKLSNQEAVRPIDGFWTKQSVSKNSALGKGQWSWPEIRWWLSAKIY